MKVRERVFPVEEHPNRISNTKCSALKSYIGVTLFRKRRLYLEIIKIYIRIYINNYKYRKRPCFLREKKELCERILRGTGKAKGCSYIKISKIKEKQKK